MARKATGKVIEHEGKDGRTYRALRFTAYGRRRYVSLGAVSAAEAGRTLRHAMADVERGTWQPPAAVAPPPEPEPMPTFHEYAEEWWLRNERQFAENTRLDYRWRLESHLLPFFKDHLLDTITFDLVERYIAGKLAEDKPLSPRSINMTVTLLAAILEGAVERELIARNPAKGRGRRVRERAPRRSYLETAAQIEALLDAAGELDRMAHPACQHVERRAMLATLTFAGLRIGELCALRWRDVDLAAGWLHVGESKTDAGRRRVKLRGALRDELLAVRARRSHAEAEAYVFSTLKGGRPSPNNLRSRVLRVAVERANENLAKRKLAPLPERITPHSLRRTFASVLYALGEDPGIVMDEMGHANPGLALRVYRQAMRRGEDERAQLRALIEGGEVAGGLTSQSLSRSCNRSIAKAP
ncbi:MAG TPA: tyrosine-type recombinase/integrase [Solirubrobacteraceae bacterium]|nr:tyrosine-type recombinase/integrase [Solirubrobacteraceae bacterium]